MVWVVVCSCLVHPALGSGPVLWSVWEQFLGLSVCSCSLSLGMVTVVWEGLFLHHCLSNESCYHAYHYCHAITYCLFETSSLKVAMSRQLPGHSEPCFQACFYNATLSSPGHALPLIY